MNTIDPDDLPELMRSTAVTPTLAVADPELAARLGPLPQLHPALAAEQRPPTIIVGTPEECRAVLVAAEAVVASSRGRSA